jgi:hypothetical protein
MLFLAQSLWWLFPFDRQQLGFSRYGLFTKLRARAHRRNRRRCMVGLLTADTRFPNIIDLHLFWLNERCGGIQFLQNPDCGAVDCVWVFAQDPLTSTARRKIDELLGRLRPGTPIINGPSAYDFFHRADAFAMLAGAGVPVPRSQFDDDRDMGRAVMWKGLGTQSKTVGPEPYNGDKDGYRAFEFIDTRGTDGLHCRYRAFFLLGEVFLSSAFRSQSPIVRYDNVATIDRDWQPSDDLVHHVRKIAAVSGLDFFAADFVRRHGEGPPIFTDINVFPMLKDKDRARRRYGHGHDFDHLRPATGTRSPWEVLEDAVSSATRPR